MKAWSSRVNVEYFSEHFHEILSSIGVVLSDFRHDFRYFCLRKYCKGGFRGVHLEALEAVLEEVKVEISENSCWKVGWSRSEWVTISQILSSIRVVLS